MHIIVISLSNLLRGSKELIKSQVFWERLLITLVFTDYTFTLASSSLIILFIIFISLSKNDPVISTAKKSVTGHETHTPVRPKNIGSMITAGMNTNNSLERFIMSAGVALPMAWKKVPPRIGTDQNVAASASLSNIILLTKPRR